jgi:hypothetical protein
MHDDVGEGIPQDVEIALDAPQADGAHVLGGAAVDARRRPVEEDIELVLGVVPATLHGTVEEE